MPRQISKATPYATRLHDIGALPSLYKLMFLQSIADDISAVFIGVSKQVEKGILNEEHTAPINDVIEIIKGTDVSQRRKLERKMKRYARLARRFKGEGKWMRREFGEVVKQAEAVSGRWRERLRRLRGNLDGMRRTLLVMEKRSEFLMARVDGRTLAREQEKVDELA